MPHAGSGLALDLRRYCLPNADLVGYQATYLPNQDLMTGFILKGIEAQAN